MKRWNKCPNCGNYETDHVHTETYSDMIERVVVCHDCSVQFTAKFSLFDRQIDMGPDEGA